jgi:hypothetical protein
MAQVSLCGICGGQIGTGTGFCLEFFTFSVNIMLAYHPQDEQYAH